MKKICFNGLKKVMSPKEMKNILGGSSSYRCCCGMGSNIDCFDVTADSCRDAAWAISFVCGDNTSGCFCDD